MLRYLALFHFSSHFNFSFKKLFKHCHKVMKFCMVNKQSIVNRFFVHTLNRNITRLAIITCKITLKNPKKKFSIFRGGGVMEKSR